MANMNVTCDSTRVPRRDFCPLRGQLVYFYLLFLFCIHLPLRPTCFSFIADINQFVLLLHVDVPPPAKRRRGLAGSIVSTALSTALIGTAVSPHRLSPVRLLSHFFFLRIPKL